MRYILLLVLFAFLVDANGQIGIIRSYKALKEGRIKEYSEYVHTKHAFGSFQVVFKDESGKEHKFKLNKTPMWGYIADEERVFRVNEKKEPCVIIVLGKMVVYGNYSTKFDDEGTATMRVNQFRPSFSKGLNGEMEILTKKNLLAHFRKGSKEYAEVKQYSKSVQELVDYIKLYNSRFEEEQSD